MSLLWVAAGGACGAVLRFLMVKSLTPVLAGFPLGTLVVNVLGSFLIGVFAVAALLDQRLVPGGRLFFQTGLLGAFTTFSAFSLDTLQLWQSGQVKSAMLNVMLNTGLCLVSVYAGSVVGSALLNNS